MTDLIVGLGNPGPQYKNTRHNIGFEILEALCDSLKLSFRYDAKFLCEMAQYKTNKSNFFFIKPQTFMNLSGESVIKVKDYFKIEKIFVIHDDLDLPFGAVRFKFGGSSGGHNGLKSLDKFCGNTYYRLRYGIGRDLLVPVIDYVLMKFIDIDKKQAMINHCVSALQDYLQYRNFIKLQNLYTLKKG